jgi:RimJ/RimL family protein N-acetyltransferase
MFVGERVRLVAADAATDAEMIAAWSADSELRRLLDGDPARPVRAGPTREVLARENEDDLATFTFGIHTLAEDRRVGFVSLNSISWSHGDAWLVIAVGGREEWGKGFGSDALRLILAYAFGELNLHRVSLTVFEYNPRALRTYERAGFVAEGRARKFLNRDGRRWDMIYMGLLREDWLAQGAGTPEKDGQ